MKRLADFLSILRLVLSPILLFTEPFGAGYLSVYLLCGLLDILDGAAARAASSVSASGALLDSAADAAFFVCMAVSVLRTGCIPNHVLLAAACILALRLLVISVLLLRFKRLYMHHTILNKLCGLALFALPFALLLKGLEKIYFILMLSIALLSAIDELIISLRIGDISPDCRSSLSVISLSREKEPKTRR